MKVLLESSENMEYRKAGINKNTWDILFLDDDNLPEDEWQSLENFKILYTIDVYTQMVHKNIFEKALMKLANRKFNIDLDNIKYNKETKSHEYVLSNGEVITFEMLSEHLIDQPKSMVKELESKERKGKCHSMSFGLGISIKDSIVHTGTITVGNRKVLHSVCEMKDKNGNIVFLDWTRNLHIDKDEYIKLFNFKILSSIKTEDILNDIKFLEHMSGLDMKTYLVFRDEMMKDLEKNEFLFEQDNESHNKTK